jgi:SAM-dependent methyltransferase
VGKVSEQLLDLTDEYESMLNQGIRLSGESMLFFLEGRLRLLRKQTLHMGPVSRILDFGCGLGHASAHLREMFPTAEITGADASPSVLAAARRAHSGPGIRFIGVDELEDDAARYDVCYVNGVFHHIPVAERPEALRLIHLVLRPKGTLALFENNPWNPGARMVMARIPFDRDAHMMSPLLTAGLVRQAGFEILRTDSLFFFPRFLKTLRRAEPFLSWTHLGAQYLVLASRS